MERLAIAKTCYKKQFFSLVYFTILSTDVKSNSTCLNEFGKAFFTLKAEKPCNEFYSAKKPQM